VTQDSAPIQHELHPPLLRVFSADFSRPVRIEFDGAFGTDTGFYSTGPTAAVTQCAGEHARAIFPCFDAPVVRSRLRLMLHTPPGTVALSNMPMERQDGPIHIFAPTPPLPTYLFAWTFDRFECVRRTTSRGVPIEFYAQSDSANLDLVAELADAEVKIVEFEECWCGQPLPPGRLQIAFVPRFCFSAMENYGLIILSDSAVAKRIPAMRLDLLMHETFHQWHGDLVTIESWENLYVNEGFARLMPKLWASELFENHEMINHWKRLCFSRMVSFDIRPNTHAAFARGFSGDVDNLFDVIGYDKAGMIFFQVRKHIGPDAFQDAMRRWYRERAWTSVGHADLWALFNRFGDCSRFARMAEEPGYPLIVLDEDGLIWQVPFAFVPGTAIWDVPLVVQYEVAGEVVTEDFWLGGEPVQVRQDAAWVCLNPTLELECRVWYKGKYYEALVAARDEGKIPELAWWRIEADLACMFTLGLSTRQAASGDAGLDLPVQYRVTCDINLPMMRFAEVKDTGAGTNVGPSKARRMKNHKPK
jgi:aminopeptidase N